MFDDPLTVVMAVIFALIGLAVAVGAFGAIVRGFIEQSREHKLQIEQERLELRERENRLLDEQLGEGETNGQ